MKSLNKTDFIEWHSEESVLSLKRFSENGLLKRLLFHSRIQRIPQPVAQKVVSQNGDHDGNSGKQHDPGGCKQLASTVCDHLSPAGCGGTDTQAQEAESGFGNDGGGNGKWCFHSKWSDTVGKDMLKHDAEIAFTDGPRGFYEFFFFNG